MTLTAAAFEGSATIGSTEHSLTADDTGPVAETSVGAYALELDLSALAAGDVFVLQIYSTVASSGGTQRKCLSVTFADAQSSPNWKMNALPMAVGWDFTLQKSAGTDRAIAWRIFGVT